MCSVEGGSLQHGLNFAEQSRHRPFYSAAQRRESNPAVQYLTCRQTMNSQAPVKEKKFKNKNLEHFW